ncbi:MAG: SMC-Scp complex subunit ScpB [Candidatus Pacebacteria bacterium]|nr:SMC-Scp complex subunit ScpB [Candidatus Paceibacterota bacterium]
MKDKYILEKILFISGELIKKEKLLKLMGSKEVDSLIDDLNQEYQETERGFTILKIEKSDGVYYQLNVSGIDDILEKMNKSIDSNLSDSALETLSIIAYRGPVSRSFIDEIRGVNSSYILRNLLLRGLIEKETSKDKNNLYLYRVSEKFMQLVGVNDITLLDEFEKINKLDLNSIENE